MYSGVKLYKNPCKKDIVLEFLGYILRNSGVENPVSINNHICKKKGI